ncbi:PREDICTED: uncharacterized protein LOC104589790 [Nelumbo nucifera]|uniref:Uncharacterized protein LOC104589790 n=1 Tax=Nelumbo nucifera TaxID=4432 RepID=A0A1U7Z332_NELNU|nr:PREDICTED: uncharacterized protein LOC104589790 [Nelumbo nucifera]
MAIKGSSFVKWPPKLRGDPATRNLKFYCHFHHNTGHSIENYRNIHDEIEELIHCGYLKKYILREGRESMDCQADQRREALESSRRNEQPPRQQQLPKDRPIRGVINMITGGSIVARCNTSAGKTSVQELEHEAENPPKRPRIEEPIYFMEDDARGIQYPHDDALIVKLLVINYFEVKRILVDLSSSIDIIFLEAFEKLQLQQSDMQPTTSPLVGFNSEVVRPLGRIIVPVAARTWPNLVFFEHTILMVANPSPYNMILGRPILYTLRAVVST